MRNLNNNKTKKMNQKPEKNYLLMQQIELKKKKKERKQK